MSHYHLNLKWGPSYLQLPNHPAYHLHLCPIHQGPHQLGYRHRHHCLSNQRLHHYRHPKYQPNHHGHHQMY